MRQDPSTIAKGLEKAIERIVSAKHGDPFSFLGMHRVPGSDEWEVRAFLPQAKKAFVIDTERGETLAELKRVHPTGVFSGRTGRSGPAFRYHLKIVTETTEVEFEDPYRFPPILDELDVFLIAEGKHLRLDEKLGAHVMSVDGVTGVGFAVWAPNAARVSVVGDFNGWDGRRNPMRFRVECGVWELFLPNIGEGSLYKYEIATRKNELLTLKLDPFAFQCEQSPGSSGIVCELRRYRWQDGSWMSRRAETIRRDAPISIYEMHLGSWQRNRDTGSSYLSYREAAEQVVPYVRDLGFTHIQLLPVVEHPVDGSWGFEPIGLYAPTSRFGRPDDFRMFVERCHEAGIGIIMDWVPAHFPGDAHGLGYFDGTHLYEYSDPRQGRRPESGALIYSYGRYEVSDYLINNALFWLQEYHVDALQVDSVAAMLYLDYSRRNTDWVPNPHGGNENLEAIAFLRRFNEVVYEHHPDCATLAEESTSWPMVSRPTYLGGLGFGYKWNLAWMNDTLAYMSRDPIFRKYMHDRLTFGIMNAFSENYVLALSHNEVVRGKGSLIRRMPGDRWQRFANLRCYYAYMFTHPGKKLLFMGNEFAQEREWDHNGSLDWHLLDDPLHDGVRRLVRDLNNLYRTEAALHVLDCEPGGFDWIDCTDIEKSVYSFLRRGAEGQGFVVVVCNFTPVIRRGYRIGVPEGGTYREQLNTDSALYGGSDVGNAGAVQSRSVECHGRPFSIDLILPPLATIVLKPER